MSSLKGYNLDNSFKEKVINQFNNEYGISFIESRNKNDVERLKNYNEKKYKYTDCINSKLK